MKDVIVLTSSTCGYCKLAKDFLNQNKIHYVEKDVNLDPQARHEMTSRNITGVPTFLIGKDVVVGFDKKRILELVDHRLVQCPDCKTTMRVPINEGRIRAKCPKCKSPILPTAR